MAAYASLISLSTLIDQILDNPRPPITLHPQHLLSLSKNISFMQEFLETYSQDAIEGAAEGLERRIAKVAYAAADVIESHIENQIKGRPEIEHLDRDLHEVIQQTCLVMEEAMEIEQKLKDHYHQLHQPIISDGNFQRTSSLGLMSTGMVGFEDVFTQVFDKLIGDQQPSARSRIIIPIVGMGGIGKTTLASKAFEGDVVMRHFDTRLWVTISQDYNVRDILLKLLDKMDGSEEALRDKLYKTLFDRRYLVVMDDMWSLDLWNEINNFFPENGNGSRIIVTTRLSYVGTKLSEENIVNVDFLDEHKSWNLLCKVVFGEEVCPTELEESGKRIAKNCKGLPLSITIMGGLLAKSKRTQENWGFIAAKLISSINLEHEQHCSKIIRTSFNHMPVHLKPCFLYMGVFPEDDEIKVSHIIKLWVAEGFVKPIYGKSLESSAEEYLMDLIRRNLILVKGVGSIEKIKTCSIHDVTRELCIKEAEREGFLFVPRKQNLDMWQGIDVIKRRIVIHGSTLKDKHLHQVLDALQSTSCVHCVVCGKVSPELFSIKWRMLDVVHSSYSDDKKLLEKFELIFQNVNFRSLTMMKPLPLQFSMYTSNYDRRSMKMNFPSSLHLLWNLQTLIINRPFTSRLEIWNMYQLKHVKVKSMTPSDPPQGPQEDELVLRNLQTLCSVRNFTFSEEVVRRVPNIKKLKIDTSIGELLEYPLNNLGHLHKLESLTCLFVGGSRTSDFSPLQQIITFSHSLVKLKLHYAPISWEEVTSEIGSLPNLQALSLLGGVEGSEWNLVQGKFQHLKFLQISWVHLKCWTSESDVHFPCLKRLSLSYLMKLEEMPPGIGDVPNLQSIELKRCTDSLVNSAHKILEEQIELGNDVLKVKVWNSLAGHFVELRPDDPYIPMN